MKVSINEILNAINVVRVLSNTPMKAKTAYKIAKLINIIDKEYNTFQDVRNNVIKKYGVYDENGNLKIDDNNNYVIKPEYQDDFANELNELLKEQVDINISPLEMNDFEEHTFTPNEMGVLAPFITEE